jgi:hypothetical protein
MHILGISRSIIEAVEVSGHLSRDSGPTGTPQDDLLGGGINDGSQPTRGNGITKNAINTGLSTPRPSFEGLRNGWLRCSYTLKMSSWEMLTKS